jgi:hypothetical protein
MSHSNFLNQNDTATFVCNKSEWQLSGTYDDIHLRPFVPHFDGHIQNELDEATEGGANFSREALVGVAPKIIQISSDVHCAAPIVNGFNEERYHFCIDISPRSRGGIQSDMRYILTGYSDYAGANDHGTRGVTIDPDLRLYLNAAYVVRDTVAAYGHGVHSVITESHQFLHNPKAANDFMESISLFAQRPEDVFGLIDQNTNPLMDRVNQNAGYRVDDYRNSVNVSMKRNRRDMNTSAGWLSNTLGSFASAVKSNTDTEDSATFVGEDDNVYSKARDKSRERSLGSSPLLRTLVVNYDLTKNGYITYSDLCAVIADLDRVTVINTPSYGLYSRGSQEHWHGSDDGAVACQMILTQLPSILQRHCIGAFSFHATNTLTSAQIAMLPRGTYVDSYDVSSSHVITPLSFDSFASNVDLSQDIYIAMESIAREILAPLSMNHQLDYDVTVNCDMLGDTSVSISIGDDRAITDRTAPSFCDHLYSPNLTDQQYGTEDMLSDVCDMLGHVRKRVTSWESEPQEIITSTRDIPARHIAARQDRAPVQTPTRPARRSSW